MGQNRGASKAFDELLRDAGEEYVRQMLEEIPDEEELANMFPDTSSLDLKMESVYRAEKRAQAARRFSRWGHRAAVIALVAVGTCVATIFSVKALRVQFLSMFVEPHPEYTAFSFRDPDTGGSPDYTVPRHLQPVENDYEATYVPEGYQISQQEEYQYMKMIIYENAEGDVIHLDMMEATGTGISLDTENAETGTTTVSGNEAFWVQKEQDGSVWVTILWHDNEWAFTLMGAEPYEEMLKMAEGVEREA
ncbi:MAG: DUF4367 domain-containing protein [Oscillospiraceae bacterium]|nr:DUF4367 domain-containing protein [Oscillospiraceae bacterium]